MRKYINNSSRFARAYRTLRNKGGKAYIYKIKEVYRIIFKYFSGEILKSKLRFESLRRALNYARRVLLDYYINNFESDEVSEEIYNKNGLYTFYPVYRKEYFRDRVFGHDDLCLSYWYALGSGRAYASTYASKRHNEI